MFNRENYLSTDTTGSKYLSTDINNLISTDIELIPTDISTDRKNYEVDYLFNELKDLVNQKFRAWYISRFYTLGKEKVLRLASIARADGKDPQKYFSHLLKTTS